MAPEELNKLKPTLTDFINNETVFFNSFKQNAEINDPIKNVLELGVYRIPGDSASNLPGQSTKSFIIINKYYPIKNMISLDIDDCQETIDNCVKWCQNNLQINGIPGHRFVQCNSIEFKVEDYFKDGVDFIFLDTNHDDNYPQRLGYEGETGGAGMTFREILYYAKHLSKNGRMFIHDTKNYYVEKQYGFNTEGAIQKFMAENDGYYFYEHNTNENGLGEIIRLDSDIYEKYYK